MFSTYALSFAQNTLNWIQSASSLFWNRTQISCKLCPELKTTRLDIMSRHIKRSHAAESEDWNNYMVVDNNHLQRLNEIHKLIRANSGRMIYDDIPIDNSIEIPEVKWDWDGEKSLLRDVKGTCPFCKHSTTRPLRLAQHIAAIHWRDPPFRKSLRSFFDIFLGYNID